MNLDFHITLNVKDDSTHNHGLTTCMWTSTPLKKWEEKSLCFNKIRGDLAIAMLRFLSCRVVILTNLKVNGWLDENVCMYVEREREPICENFIFQIGVHKPILVMFKAH